MLELHRLKISGNLGKDELNKMLSAVSLERKDKIYRFHKYEDAQRSLLGEALARYALCQRSGIKNSHLSFGSNEFGKPVLIDPPGLHFNISHSGNWVGCVVDDNHVGIDIEAVKPIDVQTAERFFSKDEWKSLLDQPAGKKLNYFYMLWTLKESFIKADGKGLSIPLDSFTMNIDENGIGKISCSASTKYNFFLYSIDSCTICSVCSFAKEHLDYYYDIEHFMKISNLFL